MGTPRRTGSVDRTHGPSPRARRSELDTLLQIERAARAGATDDELCRTSARLVAAHLGCDAVTCYVIRDGMPMAVAAAGPARDLAPDLEPGAHGVMNAALANGRPAAFIPHHDTASHPPMATDICVPMRGREAVTGLLAVHDESPGRVTEHDLWFLVEVARIVGGWLGVSALPPWAERAAETDGGPPVPALRLDDVHEVTGPAAETAAG